VTFAIYLFIFFLKFIPSGIGHRVKSVQNPDSRVSILIAYARENFPFQCRMLDYALEVEKITTAKRNK
jgi:citrate synthase